MYYQIVEKQYKWDFKYTYRKYVCILRADAHVCLRLLVFFFLSIFSIFIDERDMINNHIARTYSIVEIGKKRPQYYFFNAICRHTFLEIKSRVTFKKLYWYVTFFDNNDIIGCYNEMVLKIIIGFSRCKKIILYGLNKY